MTFSSCVQSSGKLEMERGMVKPMIRGEQQDSRSHFICFSWNTWGSLPTWNRSHHVFSSFHQVSGGFSRQDGAVASSQHRVQRQLWVFLILETTEPLIWVTHCSSCSLTVRWVVMSLFRKVPGQKVLKQVWLKLDIFRSLCSSFRCLPFFLVMFDFPLACVCAKYSVYLA